MSLTDIHRAREAGFEAGWRDARDGRSVSLFREQRSSAFGLGYRDGYRAGLVGEQETWNDYVGDLLLEHYPERTTDGSDDD